MTKRKQNKWRKWQASAAATLTIAALFQYVRTSDAFDVAYASVNGTDTGSVTSAQTDSRDDVMDEWSSSSTDSYSWNTDESTSEQNQGQTYQQSDRSNDSRTSSSGNYRSRTGAS